MTRIPTVSPEEAGPIQQRHLKTSGEELSCQEEP